MVDPDEREDKEVKKERLEDYHQKQNALRRQKEINN